MKNDCRKFLLLSVFMMVTSLLSAEEITIFLDSRIPIFKKIAEVFQNSFPPNSYSFHQVSVGAEENSSAIKSKPLDRTGKFIFCIGEKASLEGRATGLKGVFILVINPEKNGLVDKKGIPLTPLSGIYSTIEPQTVCEFIAPLIPKKNITIGIVYNPEISTFTLSQFIQSTIKGCQICSKEVTLKENILPAFKTLKADIFIGLMDPLIYTPQTLPAILQTSILKRIPFVGYAPQHIKQGALLALYSDYEDLGRQAAELLIQTIKNEKPTGMHYPQKFKYSLNLSIARHMNVEIPGDVIKKASEVIS